MGNGESHFEFDPTVVADRADNAGLTTSFTQYDTEPSSFSSFSGNDLSTDSMNMDVPKRRLLGGYGGLNVVYDRVYQTQSSTSTPSPKIVDTSQVINALRNDLRTEFISTIIKLKRVQVLKESDDLRQFLNDLYKEDDDHALSESEQNEKKRCSVLVPFWPDIVKDEDRNTTEKRVEFLQKLRGVYVYPKPTYEEHKTYCEKEENAHDSDCITDATRHRIVHEDLTIPDDIKNEYRLPMRTSQPYRGDPSYDNTLDASFSTMTPGDYFRDDV